MYNAKDSILALLAEADSGLSELEGLVRSYCATSHRIVRDDDLSVGKAHYRLQDVVQPPVTLAVKLLSIGTHLRSPLDHIVVNLTRTSGIPPGKNPSFPICVSEKEWKDNNRMLKGLSVADEAAVRSIQPFEQHYGGNPDEHPLALLQTLSNLTKHNIVLTVQVVVVDSSRHHVYSNHRINYTELFQAPFENGAEIGVLVPGKAMPNEGAIVLDMGMRGRGTLSSFAPMMGVHIPTVDDNFERGDFKIGEPADEETNNRLNAGFAAMKAGVGPWVQASWDDYFSNIQFDLKLSQTVLFGPGSERLENLPVLETLYGIRRYLDNNVFQKDGLIERLV